MTHLAIANVTAKISQLRVGTKIRLSDSIVTVSGMKWRNGRDGTEPYFIEFNGRAAAALEISFEDHEPLLAHLDQDAILAD